jgi:hypothetical protein
VVADLQFLYPVTDLLDHAGELVAERHPHPGIRHGPVVQVQVGPADTRSRNPDDGVLGVQDLRFGFVVDADPMGPPVIHGEHGSGSSLVASTTFFFE